LPPPVVGVLSSLSEDLQQPPGLIIRISPEHNAVVRYAEGRKEDEVGVQQALRQGAGEAAAGPESRTGKEFLQSPPADGRFSRHRDEGLAISAEPAAGIVSVLENPFDGQRPAPRRAPGNVDFRASTPVCW